MVENDFIEFYVQLIGLLIILGLIWAVSMYFATNSIVVKPILLLCNSMVSTVERNQEYSAHD